MSFSPAQVKMRHCCFCIPVRAAVLALSLAAATLSAIQAINACIRMFSSDVYVGDSPALNGLQAICWFTLVGLTLYGWAGAVSQRFDWIEIFYELAWWHLVLNVIFGIYFLLTISLPAAKQRANDVCVQNVFAAALLENDLTTEAAAQASLLAAAQTQCEHVVKFGLIFLDMLWVLAILVELYLVLVVAHYGDELADLDAAKQFGVDIESPNPPYRFARVEKDPLVQAQVRRKGRAF
ncbi:hypothetical protein JCM10207_005981 [Rhodosporidiobolus poonsookiae]